MIVSIDVGIKNLSFCILSRDASTKIQIHSWGILDLTRDDIDHVCCHTTKKGTCGKKSSYTIGGKMYFCGTHIKKCDTRCASEDYYKAKKKINKTIIDRLCKTYNHQDKDSVLQYIFETSVTKIAKLSSAAGIDIVDIGRAISSKLSTIINKTNVHKVLIENQIGPIANRMKCVQGMIAQFFIERGIYDISFISSSNKLRCYDVPKKTYKERKQSGIEITRTILNDNKHLSEWEDCFNNHKKRDDLADSLLQGLWFINNK